MSAPLPSMVCPGCRRSGKSEKHCEQYAKCRWRECECGVTFNTATGDAFKELEDKK